MIAEALSYLACGAKLPTADWCLDLDLLLGGEAFVGFFRPSFGNEHGTKRTGIRMSEWDNIIVQITAGCKGRMKEGYVSIRKLMFLVIGVDEEHAK
jgi:hypothetical protein